MTTESGRETAATSILRSLAAYDVEYVFGNFGTDHPPFLEAAAELRESEPEALPEFVTCPHESVAMSAAHGYAIATGRPQAVIVHVDVGTQNLGSMVHDAHRGNAPIYVIAGLAPVSHDGHRASRSAAVHYLQDVYDQPGIVRQFCRWTGEFRPPADPDELVARGLRLASTSPRGPVYLTASREALDTAVPAAIGSRDSQGVDASPADEATVARIGEAVVEATAPLVVTSKLGLFRPRESIDALVRFAERAGAGVVEAAPSAVCFPRTHERHVGFDVEPALERADLVILADVDVPWVPATVDLPEDMPIIHLDSNPEKPTYPRWDFPVTDPIKADAARTLEAVNQLLADADAAGSGEHWEALHGELRAQWAETADGHAADGRLTPSVLTEAIDEIVDGTTTVVNETTTNNPTVLRHLELDRPGSYYHSHGSGLGWAPGAAVGVKFARPESTVMTLVGDGSYVFSNPTASSWVQGAHDVPTLTVVYNNAGWRAVRRSVGRVHPDGRSADHGTPESRFDPRMDLSHAANVVDAHTAVVETANELSDALASAKEAVESGTPAVVDVRLEPF